MFKIITAIGIFNLDDKGELVEFCPFISDTHAVDTLIESSANILNEGYGVFWEKQRELVEKLGIDFGEYLKKRHDIAIQLAEEMCLRSIRDVDIVIHGVETLEDVHKALNILTSRLAATCSTYGQNIEFCGEDRDYERVLKTGKKLSIPALEGLSVEIESLIHYITSLEEDIKTQMGIIAPNLMGLIGPLLGAKLISLAKGLDRLAKMPASRIQVLGANHAMFRFLKKKGSPPKHGIIFQHPLLSMSPWWQRGKIARSLAAKIAIAARLDAYSSNDRSQELKEDFMKRYEAIKKTFIKEPKRMRIIKTPPPPKVKKKRRKRR